MGYAARFHLESTKHCTYTGARGTLQSGGRQAAVDKHDLACTNLVDEKTQGRN